MILIYFILFNITFSISDSSKVEFPNLKNLKLDLGNLIDIKKGLKNNLNQESFLNKKSIDSIKTVAKKYIPTEISKNDTILIETTKGFIKLIYFPDIAPNHCYNFKKLANSGFYDNTTFHRTIKNFMIQGGDILTRDSNKENDGQGDPGWTINQEFNQLSHKRGTLSMARSTPPNSAGSQFFICQKATPWLDSSYTIFGEVIENIYLMDLIANSPTSYSEAKKKCFNKIPENENSEDWIELKDPKNNKLLFSKVPIGTNKTDYLELMLKDIRSDRPIYPVKIKKIRVLDGK